MTSLRSPRSRLFAAAAVLPVAAVVALSGCSSDDAPAVADDGPCAASASVDRDGVRPITVSPAEVTVLETGAAPLAPLTVAPDTTSVQKVTLTTDSIEASIAPGDDGKQSVQSTEQQLTTAISARVVCDDPTNVEFTIASPTSKDDELTPELAALNGSPGGITVGDGLAMRSLRLFPNEDSGSPARNALEQSFTGALDQTVVLPTEPVGVGARWTSVRTIAAAATIRRTTTATLTARDGDVLTIALHVDEEPVDSVFRIPGSAQTLDIARYSMSGDGEITVDLRRLLPVGGSLTTRGARELVGDPGSVPLLQQNEYTVSWTS